jgi:hypothetical protein
MIKIKRETIIKVGDTIIHEKSNEAWKVSKIEGLTFYFKDKSGKEYAMTKFALITSPDLKLELADDRGYY